MELSKIQEEIGYWQRGGDPDPTPGSSPLVEGTLPLGTVRAAGGRSFVSKELLHGEVQYFGTGGSILGAGTAMS